MYCSLPVSPVKKKKKRAKMEDCIGDEDFITNLPDEILISILSLLTRKESVRCGTLSRRWAFVRKLVPIKLICIEKITKVVHRDLRAVEDVKFISLVNKVVDLYQGEPLDEFNIGFPLSNRYKDEVNKWIQIAMENKVKKFELNFLPCGWHGAADLYQFPSIFNHKEVRQWHDGLPGCTSLTTLRLSAVNVTGEHIQQFLKYCPLLESVCVIYSDTLTCLKVDRPARLKILDIQLCKNLNILEISAPNLSSFKYLARSKTRVLLESAPRLIEMFVGHEFYSFLVGNLNLFVGHLSQLETLSLIFADGPSMDLQDVKRPMKIPTLRNLKQLSITVTANRRERKPIYLTSWIQASPVLRRFVIEKRGICSLPHSSTPRETMKPSIDLHQHIKEFEFIGFEGDDMDIEFVLYMIENAVNLEKIVLDCRRFFGTTIISVTDSDTSVSVAKNCVRNISPTIEFVLIH